MPRKREPIKVTSQVNIKGKWVDIDTLSDEQREYIATWLTVNMLNDLYTGEIVFEAKDMPPASELF